MPFSGAILDTICDDELNHLFSAVLRKKTPQGHKHFTTVKITGQIGLGVSLIIPKTVVEKRINYENCSFEKHDFKCKAICSKLLNNKRKLSHNYQIYIEL